MHLKVISYGHIPRSLTGNVIINCGIELTAGFDIDWSIKPSTDAVKY